MDGRAQVAFMPSGALTLTQNACCYKVPLGGSLLIQQSVHLRRTDKVVL
jgi:hypothetical protein